MNIWCTIYVDLYTSNNKCLFTVLQIKLVLVPIFAVAIRYNETPNHNYLCRRIDVDIPPSRSVEHYTETAIPHHVMYLRTSVCFKLSVRYEWKDFFLLYLCLVLCGGLVSNMQWNALSLQKLNSSYLDTLEIITLVDYGTYGIVEYLHVFPWNRSSVRVSFE